MYFTSRSDSPFAGTYYFRSFSGHTYRCYQGRLHRHLVVQVSFDRITWNVWGNGSQFVHQSGWRRLEVMGPTWERVKFAYERQLRMEARAAAFPSADAA